MGWFYLGLSPIAAAFGAWASTTVSYGVVFGALFLFLGLYTAFVYAPFAEWIRRRERSRRI
jgi:ammonia channel protein AmtB